jgi:AraC family ethanolamine operon transcriptional activator
MLTTSLQPAQPTLRCARIENLAEGEDIPGWELKFLQMSAGQVKGDSRVLEIEGLQLVRENYDGAVLNEYGSAPSDTFLFGVPLFMSGEGLFNGGAWHNGLCMARAEREFNAVMPPTDMLSVVVQREKLIRYVQATEMVDLSNWLSRRSLIVNDPRLTREIAVRINDVLMACFHDEADLSEPAMRQAILDSVLEVLSPVVAQHADAPPPAFREISRSLIVQKAREFTVANIHEPLQVIDICRATGVSRRALQVSFQDVLGVSPLAYLRLIRLNGARQALLQPEQGLQVKHVVAKWGFWHLSRFSAEYRDLFGELPSETLRRTSATQGAPA